MRLATDSIAAQVDSDGPLKPGVMIFRPLRPQVAEEKILRIQGYDDPARVRPAIRQAAAQMARTAEEVCEVEVVYRPVAVLQLDDQGITVEGCVRLTCGAFADRLQDCVQVVPFILSCGQALSQKVIELADAGDLLEAVLLESAGWLCIEDATRQLKHCLRSQADLKGCRITSRMGPGYTYALLDGEVSWPLEDHPNLFALFDGARLPAQLMSSCAMNPKLSRSGLYGIAPLHEPQVGRPEVTH